MYLLMRFNCISCLHAKFLQVLLEEVLTIDGNYFRSLMKAKANLYRKVIIVKNQVLVLTSPVECVKKMCMIREFQKTRQSVCEVYQATYEAVSG